MPDNFYANDPIKDNPQMKQYFNSLPHLKFFFFHELSMKCIA